MAVCVFPVEIVYFCYFACVWCLQISEMWFFHLKRSVWTYFSKGYLCFHGSCCNIEQSCQTKHKLESREISFVRDINFHWLNHFEIVHRARQGHCMLRTTSQNGCVRENKSRANEIYIARLEFVVSFEGLSAWVWNALPSNLSYKAHRISKL